MSRKSYDKSVSLRGELPTDLPSCFGELIDPTYPECLSCKAFNRCALAVLTKKDDNYYLDMMVELTDKEISEFIADSKTLVEVYQWLKKESNIIDDIALKNRISRYIKNNPNVTYKDKIISVV